jgi:hypothetical protein
MRTGRGREARNQARVMVSRCGQKGRLVAPLAVKKRHKGVRTVPDFGTRSARPTSPVGRGRLPPAAPRPARPNGERQIAHNRVSRRDRCRNAIRQPYPLASDEAPRPKSAMRSGMPQRRQARLSISGFDPPKASSSPQKRPASKASSPFARPADRWSKSGQCRPPLKSRAAPEAKLRPAFSCRDGRVRLWPKTSALGAFSGRTGETIVALRRRYSMTSSARPISVAGRSSPRALAAFRLTSNCSLVGW